MLLEVVVVIEVELAEVEGPKLDRWRKYNEEAKRIADITRTIANRDVDNLLSSAYSTHLSLFF